ncbi:MAG TPA: sensor domain-containing diguanylate cyclase [Bosea sp. (in: a-proteobacteria)]|uniref:sensor domain-containing diguanylate cyclase n=1 Tax=Bosea sp. (in: a-proteobacteria) TaxID=1871050 RepID=UPI002E12C4B2|nr:sensor domain-containing diguanylate cyclase [Bosea sp. (in: a-proteobacteria)]
MSPTPSSTLVAGRLYDQAALAPGGAWACDLSNQTLSWTNEVYDLFGLPRGSKLQRAATLDIYQSQSRSEMEKRRAAAIQTGKGFALDCQLRVGGQSRWMRLRVGVNHEHGRPVRIFGSKQDITAEKRMWDGLVTLAGNDPLTGLANRRAFETAARELSRHADGSHGFALAVLCIDDFAALREEHDHAGAHECLRCLGERLARLFPDAVLVSRIGGCEFALLLRVPGGHAGLAATLEGAHRLLARPVPRDAMPIEIGVTIGAAILKPAHRHEPKTLFAEADAALYVAKAAGNNRVRVFDGMVAKPVMASALVG